MRQLAEEEAQRPFDLRRAPLLRVTLFRLDEDEHLALLVESEEERLMHISDAVLLPIHSVGVMGDSRTYENVLAVRAVTTTDFMTADWARLPHDMLARISNRIVNEVDGVNRVV